MCLTGKNKVMLKIKRPVKSFESQTTDLPKMKTFKVAKKVSENDIQKRLLSKIEEDFVLEDDTLNFFNHFENNPHFEVIPKAKSISPRQGRSSPITQEPVLKSHSPRSLPKPKSFFQGPVKIPYFPSLEQKLLERDEQLRSNLNDLGLIKDKGLEKKLLTQSKSLENFEKHRKYWKKIEENISDTLEKNPEDLRITSGKLFTAKQKELEVIEKFNKINEISEETLWKTSLRTDRKELKFFQPGSSEQKASLRLQRQFTKSLAKSPTFSANSPLAKNEYFKDKLSTYKKFTEELVTTNVTQEFLVKGTNKIKLELLSVKKAGEDQVSLRPLEPYSDRVISKHYSPKVLY